ncbi:MAG: hypothetical protein M1831_006466 [Alyxoria varia]|nr:MAG: hypothetical protein M1831_006466 [Alyxoria varia]
MFAIFVSPLLIWLLLLGYRMLDVATTAQFGIISNSKAWPFPEHSSVKTDRNEHLLGGITQPQWTPVPQLGINVFPELQGSLHRMQSRFFEVWQGTYPSAIDWTAAVVNGLVSGTLHSITRSSKYSVHGPSNEECYHSETRRLCGNQGIEDTVNAYFSQNIAYYYGEDAFSLRFQAHDDMLWVVLGWLETIQFIDEHNRLHHEMTEPKHSCHSGRLQTAWFGKQFEPAFAHRANVFYSVVHKAWDTSLCGGGLTWNPALSTYKNTITNTQYITASVMMYLFHPGDKNSSPFMNTAERHVHPVSDDGLLGHVKKHDTKYLDAAIDAYDWLKAVNMTNKHGLYVDGYHINKTEWSGNTDTTNSTTSECNDRNEMVYTYNQGVILSGLRGLWEATGELRFLRDGHLLIRNVIAATGWNVPELAVSSHRARYLSLLDDQTHDTLPHPIPNTLLGHDGILEEACDPSGACNQDSQAFKGIFFHHFTHFCAPLPTDRSQVSNVSHVAGPKDALLHRNSYLEYAHWVARNAKAALKTKDEKHGIFGSWWGAPLNASNKRVTLNPERHASANIDDAPAQQILGPKGSSPKQAEVMQHESRPASTGSRDCKHSDFDRSYQSQLPIGAIDYRNIPLTLLLETDPARWKKNATFGRDQPNSRSTKPSFEDCAKGQHPTDPNERGRGRTLETQSGGVALLRALWEVLQLMGTGE